MRDADFNPRSMEFWTPIGTEKAKPPALVAGPVETCRGGILSSAEWTEMHSNHRPQFPLRHHGIYATIERHGQQHFRWLCGNEIQQGCVAGRPTPLE